MRKNKLLSKGLCLLLAMIMLVGVLPMQVLAAELYDIVDKTTGLSSTVRTDKTISLPIKILDYDSDGMLFEYSEGLGQLDAEDFGASWYRATTTSGTINTTWADFNWTNKSNNYVKYVRGTWAGNTSGNFSGNRSAMLIDFGASPMATTDAMRYVVFVYRTNVASPKFSFGVYRANFPGASANEKGNYTNNIIPSNASATEWNYAVFDLKNGSLGDNWEGYGKVSGLYIGMPLTAAGQWFELAHIAIFADENQAQKFGEYALTDGSDRGTNRAFGLLNTSQADLNADGTAENSYERVESMTTTTHRAYQAMDMSDAQNLGYNLMGQFEKGVATFGLLEGQLNEDGFPMYKQEVVEYLAGLLQHALEIPERTNDGWVNYRFVRGTKSDVYGGVDLATALRNRIQGNLGSYAETKTKKLIGKWADVEMNIQSYHDAAYFLLNSIFIDNSYNELQDDYKYLQLGAAIDEQANKETYVFDAGFSGPADAYECGVKYDTASGVISNYLSNTKPHFHYGTGANATTTLHPFLPITDKNNAEQQTQSYYYQDDGVCETKIGMDSIANRNFNYVIKSSGMFTYLGADDLFFDFEGDDDVYLFINGQLVLDIGGAHSIDIIRMNLNDYVNQARKNIEEARKNGQEPSARDLALNLTDGVSYSIKFYYMERHSYGANMRISTNIRISDPEMTVDKTAYQDGHQIGHGGVVEKDKIVEYSFAMTNNGNSRLHDITFHDPDIGVSITPGEGLVVTGERVTDLYGGQLDAHDLVAYVNGYTDYWEPIPTQKVETIVVTFENNEALKIFMEQLAAEGTDREYIGLWPHASVEIRGIGYTLSEQQVHEGRFSNTVVCTANTGLWGSGTLLHGQDEMLIYVPADPMYYQWAKHEVRVSMSEFIDDVATAVREGALPEVSTAIADALKTTTSLQIVTRSGNPVTVTSDMPVQIGTDNSISVNFPQPGSYVVYISLTYNGGKSKQTVPVLFNVTDVKDSLFVLDYGLKVDMDITALSKNDTTAVPGRDTATGMLGLITGGGYTPNNITYEGSTDTIRVTDGAGVFTFSNDILSYTPDQFMTAVETIQIATNVYEKNFTPTPLENAAALNINREVMMYQNVSVLPANVVYYEDDFPAITYGKLVDGQFVKDGGVFTQIGSGSGDLSQETDNDQPYGQDDAYQADSNKEHSGNSLHKIVIRDAETVARFEFRGTGFELMGRTLAQNSATFLITVKNAAGETVKLIPVITEFDHGGNGGEEIICQVPVIRVKDLELGSYTVEISGVPDHDYAGGNPETIIDSYLYIDGLRVFQPMGDAPADADNNPYYNANENGAKFHEIRNLIVEGMGAVAESYVDGQLNIYAGNVSFAENRNGTDASGSEWTSNQVGSVDDYLMVGPNNEVYMNGMMQDSALAFYFQKEAGATKLSLQIALRALDAEAFFGVPSQTLNANVYMGTYINGVYGWQKLNAGPVVSGTEQYYTVDLSKCYVDGDGRYQVVLRLATAPEEAGMVSFTSLKTLGLTPVKIDNALSSDVRFEGGTLVDEEGEAVVTADLPAFSSLSMLLQLAAEEPEKKDFEEIVRLTEMQVELNFTDALRKFLALFGK